MEASTATAASWISFASRDVAVSSINAETPEDGEMKDSIEYNAIRWSGPEDLPVLGRLSSSITELDSSSSDVARIIMVRNN